MKGENAVIKRLFLKSMQMILLWPESQPTSLQGIPIHNMTVFDNYNATISIEYCKKDGYVTSHTTSVAFGGDIDQGDMNVGGSYENNYPTRSWVLK